MLALMIGLAVGIDYALFIVTRHRKQLADGMDPEESAATAVATAGSAVVFAGLTVVIALARPAHRRHPVPRPDGRRRRARRRARDGRRDHAAAGDVRPARPSAHAEAGSSGAAPPARGRGSPRSRPGSPTRPPRRRMRRPEPRRRRSASAGSASCSRRRSSRCSRSSACSARSRSRPSSLDLALPDGGIAGRGLDGARAPTT